MTIELKRMPTTQPGPTTSNVIRTYAMPPSSNGRTTETRAYQRLELLVVIAGMPVESKNDAVVLGTLRMPKLSDRVNEAVEQEVLPATNLRMSKRKNVP